MNRQWLAPAIHLASNLGFAESAFHRNGNSQADVPVARRRFNVGLEIGGKNYIHAAVPGSNGPARRHLRAGQYASVHAAVPSLYTQRVEAAHDSNVAISRVRLDLAIQVARLDRP